MKRLSIAKLKTDFMKYDDNMKEIIQQHISIGLVKPNFD